MDKYKKKFTRTLKDINVVLERLRYQRGIPADPSAFAARAGHIVLNLQGGVHLGGVAIASIPDVGRPIMKYGLLRTFRDGWTPYIKGLGNLGGQLTKRELRLANVAVENVLHGRAHDLFNVGDYMVRGSKFEKGLSYATSKIGLIGLFDHWTNVMKQVTGNVVNAKLMDDLKLTIEGGGNAADRTAAQNWLTKIGLTPELQQEIWNEVRNTPDGSTQVGDHLWPNTDAWQNKRAVVAYRQALVGQANDTIITPGVARPNMMDANLATKLLFQFKNFGVASVNKTLLAGLQDRNAGVVTGSMVSLALGALSYYLYAKTVGGKVEAQMENELKSGNYARFADEAINRSGLLAALSNVQDILGDVPLTAPYVTFAGHQTAKRNESNLTSALLGPTADTVKTTSELLTQLDKPTLKMLHQMRRTYLPFQNHFIFRRALDQIGL